MSLAKHPVTAAMRIVVVGPIAGSLTRFRGSMLRDMAEAGHAVLAVGPEDDPEVRAELAADGVAYTTVPMSRAGLNPVRDAQTVAYLTRTFRSPGERTWSWSTPPSRWSTA